MDQKVVSEHQALANTGATFAEEIAWRHFQLPQGHVTAWRIKFLYLASFCRVSSFRVWFLFVWISVSPKPTLSSKLALSDPNYYHLSSHLIVSSTFATLAFAQELHSLRNHYYAHHCVFVGLYNPSYILGDHTYWNWSIICTLPFASGRLQGWRNCKLERSKVKADRISQKFQGCPGLIRRAIERVAACAWPPAVCAHHLATFLNSATLHHRTPSFIKLETEHIERSLMSV